MVGSMDFTSPDQSVLARVSSGASHQFSIVYLTTGSSCCLKASLRTLGVFEIISRKHYMTNAGFEQDRRAVPTVVDRRHVAARCESGIENTAFVHGDPVIPELLHDQILCMLPAIIRTGARRQKLSVSHQARCDDPFGIPGGLRKAEQEGEDLPFVHHA
jgi:hypothetical protein